MKRKQKIMTEILKIIDPLTVTIEVDKSELQKKIAKLLIQLGIQPNLKGYVFLRTAIYLLVARANEVLKEGSLYTLLCEIHNETRTVIESSMRHCLKMAQYGNKMHILNDIMDSTVIEDNSPLSVLQFMFYTAEAVRFSI